MRALLFLMAGLSIMAQPTITNAFADTVESHCARFGWTSSTASTDNIIKLDKFNPPTTTKTPDGSTTSGTEHGYTYCGLEAATQYWYQLCSTNGTQGCSSVGTFTTNAAEVGYATMPIAPATITHSVPTITGTTFNVNADCGNLQTQIDAAAAASNTLNHDVVIPSGAICLGRYVLPSRVGATGWVTIRTGGVIPPAGTRTSATLGANNARIISPFVAVEYYQASTPGSGTDTGQSWLKSDSTNPNAFLYFWNGSAWAPVSMTSSATDPSGSCTAGDYTYNNVTADARKRVSWCDNAGQWRVLYIDQNSDNSELPYAALYAAANAIRYRLIGLSIEPIRVPLTYAATLPTASGPGDQKTSQSGCLTYTLASSQWVIYDRVIIDGVGYPNRTRRGFCFWEGQNIALVDSFINNINYWRPTSASEVAPSALINFAGQGPFLVHNNDFTACMAICIFFSDDGGASVANPADITISRNKFYVSAVYNLGDSTSNGRRYDHRHHIECKRCTRIKIVGNILDGGFPITNQGAHIGLTPRNNGCATKQNLIRISDVDVAYNWSRFAPQFFLMTGQNDSQNNCNTKNTIRVSIRHNLVEKTGQTESGGGVGVGILNMNGQIIDMGLAVSDFSMLHNAFVNINSVSGCCQANMLSHGWGSTTSGLEDPNSRLWVMGNIYTALQHKSAGYWGIGGLGLLGTAALDASWKVGSASSYSVTGNAMQIFYNGPFDDGTSYPAGNYRNTSVANFTGAIYQGPESVAYRPLVSGIFASKSSTARAADLNDNGPDFLAYDQAQGLTTNVRAISITSSAATIAYTAPDKDTACTVEYGTSATPGTGTRVADTPGGSRFRAVALSGLAGATAHFYRVYCGQMASGTFTTN